jgi:hypothetical protein
MTRTHRVGYLILWAASILIVFLYVRGLADTAHEARVKADASAAKADRNEAATAAATSAVANLAAQVRSLGGEPVVTPSQLPQIGATGATGPMGPQGVSGRNGKRGATGARGPGPTNAQVAEGVAAYCASGRCVGPRGPSGQDGKDGADGQPGQSAYPFTFTFTVALNPVQSTTYTVTCSSPSECNTVTSGSTP